jgi:hypothetical protein
MGFWCAVLCCRIVGSLCQHWGTVVYTYIVLFFTFTKRDWALRVERPEQQYIVWRNFSGLGSKRVWRARFCNLTSADFLPLKKMRPQNIPWAYSWKWTRRCHRQHHCGNCLVSLRTWPGELRTMEGVITVLSDHLFMFYVHCIKYSDRPIHHISNRTRHACWFNAH